MREIKFRGKDLLENKWVYGFFVHYITAEEGEIYSIIDERGKWVTVDPGTIGQFIRRNKDGKELYEGDILSGHSDLMLLSYSDGSFVAKSITKHWKMSFGSSFLKYEKVGNRYDNDELLNPII